MGKINFTKKSLEALPAPSGDRYVVYRDSGAKGLGVKIEPSGHKTYFWSRKANGRLEWKTVGEFTDVSLEDARAEASKFNKARADWKKDGYTGDGPFARLHSPTLEEALNAYLERYLKKESKNPEKSAKTVKAALDNSLDDWRNRKVRELRRADFVARKEKIHDESGPYAANRLIQLVKAALNFCIDEAQLLPGPNPAAGINLYKETKRKRFLNGQELRALQVALADKETSTDLRDFVKLALFTGARKGDVMSMRWENVSFERAAWTVPDPKNEQPYEVALSSPAVEILQRRLAEQRAEEHETPYVFPSHGRTKHLTDLKNAWKELLERAGITGFRQHDMRHTFASFQAALGAPLLMIRDSLGHKSLASTQIYAQLDLSPVRMSVEAAVKAMTVAMNTIEQKPEAASPSRKALRAAPKPRPAKKAVRRG